MEETTMESASAAPSNILEQMQNLFDRNYEQQSQQLVERDNLLFKKLEARQIQREKKWKKDMKDELRTFIKDELEDVFTTCLDVEKITLRNTMAEYKNSFDMGVQELTTVMSRYENSFDRSVQGMAAVCKEKEVEIGDKLHQQVQTSLDEHRERVVKEVKRNNEAKFPLLEREIRVGIKSTCNKMKSNVAVIRSVVAKNEFTCNQIKKSVTSLGTKLTSLEEHVLSTVDNDHQDDASSYVSPPEDDDDDDDDESMDSNEEGNSKVDADSEDKEGDGIENPSNGPKRKKRKRSKKTKITKKKRAEEKEDDDDDSNSDDEDKPRGRYKRDDHEDTWKEHYGELLDYCTNQVEYSNSGNYMKILDDLIPDFNLGRWAQNQRSAYQRNAYTSKRYPSGRNRVGISADRVALLEKVPGWMW